MENVYTLWISGYKVSHALAVELVADTGKAYKFREIDSGRNYEFHMPKKACVVDKNVDNVLNVANWFTLNDFLKFLFDRYGSHYNR